MRRKDESKRERRKIKGNEEEEGKEGETDSLLE